MTETGLKSTKPFGFADKIGYMLGDFGCNMSFSLISGYMMLFYTQFIGIDLVHYGFIILATKIWDGINDPMIGALADRLSPKGKDKFKPWIFWGSFPLAFSACILFANTQNAPYAIKLATCIIGYLIWDVAYTVVNVPYGSLSSVMTADPIERAQLSTFRSFGAFLAFIPIMTLLPQFTYAKDAAGKSVFQGEKMFWIALVMGIIAFVSFQTMYRLVTERIIHQEHDGEKFSYFAMLKGFFTNRTMLGVSLSALAAVVFMMSSSSTNSLVYQLYFQNGKLASFGVLSFLPTLLLTPVMTPLLKKFGKKNLIVYPLLAGIAVFVYLLVAKEIAPMAWIVLTTVAGVASGFFNLLSWSLVADGIDAIERQTGRREEGSAYATYSMVRKLGQGIGQSLIPFIIATAIPGLSMKDRTTWVPEYGLAVKNVAAGISLVGYVLVFLAIFFIYDIDKKKEAELAALAGKEVKIDASTAASMVSRAD